MDNQATSLVGPSICHQEEAEAVGLGVDASGCRVTLLFGPVEDGGGRLAEDPSLVFGGEEVEAMLEVAGIRGRCWSVGLVAAPDHALGTEGFVDLLQVGVDVRYGKTSAESRERSWS